MHLTEDALKVLIDTVQLRLDDELDALGEDLDVNVVMNNREDVKELWVLKDLLKDLQVESRDRLRGGMEAGINVTNVFNPGSEFQKTTKIVEDLSEGYEGLAKDYAELRRELQVTQGTLGDLRAAVTDVVEMVRLGHTKLKEELVHFAESWNVGLQGLHVRLGAVEKTLRDHVGEGQVRH